MHKYAANDVIKILLLISQMMSQSIIIKLCLRISQNMSYTCRAYALVMNRRRCHVIAIHFARDYRG